MKLMVGLGNPGDKYKNNRHNAGFMYVDYVAKMLNLSAGKAGGYIAEKEDNNTTVRQYNNLILAKPLTYMNNSGKPIKKLMSEYRLPITDLMIVHDDLDIQLGKFKIQQGTGPKLHNGIESIENHLQSKDFWRLRLGIDNRTKANWIDGETYTLQDFTSEEREKIDQTFPLILDRMKKNGLI